MPMSPSAGAATAVAHPNIALVKYWGKRDAALNLPAAGSLSLTLGGDGLETRTSVRFDPALDRDVLMLDGALARDDETERASALLDLVRARSGIRGRARVESVNHFPTGAGLASSSSGFAALAAAACAAANVQADDRALSILARRGSGSAARSVHGGFVEMLPGAAADGSDAYAVPVASADHWDLRVLFLVTGTGRKPVGSRDGMNRTARTSPYYEAWVDTVATDVVAARQAISSRDVAALGEIAEWSALKMHACAMAARPGVIYFQGPTIALVHAVRELREGGLAAWFTIDAGPHVKVLCEARHAEAAATALRERPEVVDLRVGRPAGGVRIVSSG